MSSSIHVELHGRRRGVDDDLALLHIIDRPFDGIGQVAEFIAQKHVDPVISWHPSPGSMGGWSAAAVFGCSLGDHDLAPGPIGAGPRRYCATGRFMRDGRPLHVLDTAQFLNRHFIGSWLDRYPVGNFVAERQHVVAGELQGIVQ